MSAAGRDWALMPRPSVTCVWGGGGKESGLGRKRGKKGCEFLRLLGVFEKKNAGLKKRKNIYLFLLTLPVNWSATELLLTEFQNLEPAAVRPGR